MTVLKTTATNKFRKIATLKNIDHYVEKPYSLEFNNGEFKHDMYFTIKTSFIISTYVKNIVLSCLPAIGIHALIYLIFTLNHIVLGEYGSITESSGAMQLLFIVYGVCLFFGLRKSSDHMAYLNNTMMISKHNINHCMVRLILNTIEVETDKELNVIEHYRMKFIKQSLFPTRKELALEDQMYNRNSTSKIDLVKIHAQLRWERLNIDRVRNEHIAAKHIAEWKKDLYGGTNEYDLFVRKYKHRAAPAVRAIIDELN